MRKCEHAKVGEGRKALNATMAVMVTLGAAMNFAPPLAHAGTTTVGTKPQVVRQNGVEWVVVSSAANLEYIDAYPTSVITAGSTVDYLQANIELTHNIDMSGVVSNWAPLGGNGDTPFVGTFDGQGYEVTGLSISGAGAEGFIGVLGSAGVVDGLGLSGTVTASGSPDAGLLAGESYGTISGSYTMGTVSTMGAVSGNIMEGGLVGYIPSGSVEHSHSSATVNGGIDAFDGIYEGGLIGMALSATISDSYATGRVTDSSVDVIYSRVGGLIGDIQAGNVSHSYVFGTVTVSGGPSLAAPFVGGLIGNAERTDISSSFADTHVLAMPTATAAGGFIGALAFGTITNSYAVGSVDVSGKYGVAAGFAIGVGYGAVSGAYADVTTLGSSGTYGLIGPSLLNSRVANSFYPSGEAADPTGPGVSDNSLAVSKTDLMSSTFLVNHGWSTATWGLDASGVINHGLPYLRSMYPTISTASVVAEAGTTYSKALLVSGGSGGDTWILPSGTTSSTTDGLSLSPSGVLSGVPLQTGTYSFPVSVTDNLGLSNTRLLTLDVGPALSPIAAVHQAVLAGWPDRYTFTERGGYSPYTWSLASGSLPPGYTLTSGGILSGKSNDVGTYQFTVRVTDSLGATRLESATWVIEQAVSPLTVQSITLGNGTNGSLYEQTLIANGGKPAYTWSLVGGSLPLGLVLNSDGVVQGTPTASGTYTFTVAVRDTAGHTATATDTLTVEAGSAPVTPPAPPRSQPLRIGTTVLPGATAGTAYSGTLAASGGDGTYTWSLASGTMPRGLMIAANGTLFGTPQTMGMSTFTLRVTDQSGDVATKTFHLFVTPKLLPAYDRVVQVNGQVFSLSPSMVYNQTTYMPIWYVENVLKLAGVNAVWDGNLNRWELTVNTKSGAFAPVKPHLLFNNHGTPVYVNGVLVLHAPTVAHRDQSDGVMTTYMGIWYVQQVLKELGITTTWNGHVWNFVLPGMK